MTSSAHQTPSLITWSFPTAVFLIVTLHVTSLIRHVSCSSPDVVVVQRNVTAGRHARTNGGHLSTSLDEARSRDVLHPMRLRRAPTAEVGGEEEGDRKFPCYSCFFHNTSSGFTTGHKECSDPFVAHEIPEVMCSSSCNKYIRRDTNGDLTVSRNCATNCNEKVDENSSNLCCRSKLCNRSASLNPVRGHVTAAILFSALLTYLFSSRFSPFC